MDGFAADFNRFRHAGRIGSLAPQVQCVPDVNRSNPGELVTGRVAVQDGRVQSVAWRLRGSLPWQRLAHARNRFQIPIPAPVGILELRVVAESLDGTETSVAFAIVTVAWPAAAVTVQLARRCVKRFEPLGLQLSASWVRELRARSPDGTVQRFAPQEGVNVNANLNMATDAIGQHEFWLEWDGLDGNEHSRSISYEVFPRPIVLTTQHLTTGGWFYRAQHATELEVHVPNSPVRTGLPMEGVIEGQFLTPVHFNFRYRDEAGVWREKPMRLDYAPPAWSPLRGYFLIDQVTTASQ